eukprot:2296049-Pyramimonas_sp.AAC.1
MHNRCGAFMGDSPAAVFFARTFRRPVQNWLDDLRARTWQPDPPPRPQSYQEWLDTPLVPAAPPSDWSRVLWPSEALCTAWTPMLHRPVDLSCRIYADDT